MKIKFLVMDVDGTLTDGKIYMSEKGELIKVFDVKDGCGIKDILPQYNIKPIIITARNSKILERRCAELDIRELYQNSRNKVEKLDEILRELSKQDAAEYTYADCAYIGDDILDETCMSVIQAAGGWIGCPCDAIDTIVETADFVSAKRGGYGAVREFIEWIINQENIGEKE